MKYLKLTMMEKSHRTIEELKVCIENNFDCSVNTVEICDDQPQTVTMVRTGVLENDRLPEGYFIWTYQDGRRCTFKNGDIIGLNKHPRLEGLCKDITESIDWSQVKEGDIIEVDYGTGKIAGYYRLFEYGHAICSSNKMGEQNRRYIAEASVKSIRIIERTPK